MWWEKKTQKAGHMQQKYLFPVLWLVQNLNQRMDGEKTKKNGYLSDQQIGSIPSNLAYVGINCASRFNSNSLLADIFPIFLATDWLFMPGFSDIVHVCVGEKILEGSYKKLYLVPLVR